MTQSMSRVLIEEMGMEQTGQRCPKCRAPLHRKDDWVGCWECLVNKETARRGRELLERVKLADKGISDPKTHEGGAL